MRPLQVVITLKFCYSCYKQSTSYLSNGASVGFDFIIVGAGSAGCVLANRLSADPRHRVLLLEAGGSDWNPLFRVPLMTGVLLRSRYANWFYRTEPEPHLNNRQLFWPRGRVLGGSSAINGMVYTRGTPLDYDGWAQMGLPAWSFDKVLPAFKRSESYQPGANAFHGGGGPLPISRPNTPNPLFDAFVAAGQQAGYPFNPDFNGESQEGFGRYDFTTRNGERWSTARAFLDPARRRPNLTIRTDARLLKVIVENGRATGVEVLAGRDRQTIRTDGEVILSCGTVNSPAALMHSGIGDGAVLAGLGIPVVQDLKGVGKNLQDHLLARVEHACLEPVTLYGTLRGDRAAFALLRAIFLKSGPASSFPLEGGAFFKSDPALDEPDLQSHFLPGLSTAALRLPFLAKPKGRYDGHGFFANVYQLRPHSRGEITIGSADPLAAPLIKPNYLSDPADLRVLREGVKALRRVFAQPAFDRFRGPELAPGPDVVSDRDIEQWLRGVADTVFHPVGSCRMGTDDGAVVDQHLRVHGVAGLRVVDASVMPRMPSSNTHAPTVMIAERASDFILGEPA
ncbi:choline dehydrogenase [Chelatococcus asaccharovorans]|uniref:Choline dehydrogenase n=1 Tax=Chelatococcus asaccharovorans TaxID=28210 RepID=A0A2V3URR3_9HYPH|nr:choline dehydrogenase [Chelatococcus asaccharovorans]PXW63399.1 choline dehydrogenase [Chelatococcus asaccharovorans]